MEIANAFLIDRPVYQQVLKLVGWIGRYRKL